MGTQERVFTQQPDCFRRIMVMSQERKTQVLTLLRHNIPRLVLQRREQLDRKAQFAAYCIEDAFQGRLSNGIASNSQKSRLIFTAFKLQTHNLLYFAIVFGSVIHSMTTFAEDQRYWPIEIFNKVILAIYFTDVILKIIYEGLAVCIRKNMLYFF